jgi:hypothetical protein
MNFIHRLKADLASRDAAIDAAQQKIADLLVFLHSAKFTGTENGERKDWVATGDVIAELRDLRSTLQGDR